MTPWVVYDERGRAVGHTLLEEYNVIYYTSRTKRIHLLRKFNSYGVSEYVLQQLLKRNTKYIEIKETNDTGIQILLSPLRDWFSKGKEFMDPQFGDLQKHLTYSDMLVQMNQSKGYQDVLST